MPPEGTGRPYGGRTPDERRAVRRHRITDAALDLYGTVGDRATSVAQLCRAARVAPAKFYEEFSSTDDLVETLVTGYVAVGRHLRAGREASTTARR